MRLVGSLPADAAALLKGAAATGAPGSLERRVAIDRATRRVAELYPELMKRETNMKVIFPARAAFLNIFEAKAYEGGAPTYNGKFVVDPSDKATVKLLDDAMLKVAKEKWGDKAQKIFDALVKTGKPKGIEVCFVHQSYNDSDGDPYDGFDGMYYVSASAKADKRPLVIDRDKTPLVAADGRPYSGCYVNVQVEIWAQDNKFGKAIRAELKAVQFVKDGDAFSGSTPASADDFDVVDGADADDFT